MVFDLVPSSMFDSDISKLKNAFPENTIFRPHNPNIFANDQSDQWICFPEFPFTLGLKYPFPNIFMDLFNMTGLCYSQTMPMIWRTLFVIQSVNNSHNIHLGIPEIAQTYHLRSHGSNYFLFKIKPKRKHLALRVTRNDHNWRERFFFVDRNSLPEDELIPTVWLTKVSFEKQVPPLPYSEKLIKNFLQIPEIDRTFSYPLTPEAMKSEKATPSTPASYFSLSDIDDEDVPSKEEKPATDLSKDRTLNLRSRSISKKRRIDSKEDPDEPPFDFDKAIRQVSSCYKEKVELIENLKKAAAISARENASLKREIKDAKDHAAQKDAEVRKRIEEEREIMIAGIKKDATVAVLNARILMASEASAKGLDTSFWNLQAWQEKLAKLKSENPDVDDSLDGSGGKAPKTSASKALKTPPETTIEVENLTIEDPESSKETHTG